MNGPLFAQASALLFSAIVVCGVGLATWELGAALVGRDRWTIARWCASRPQAAFVLACALSIAAGAFAGHLATVVER